MSNYLRMTRTASYGYLAALPLLVLYEVLIVYTNAGQEHAVRVTADMWTWTVVKQGLHLLGGNGNVFLAMGILLVGFFIFFRDGKRAKDAEEELDLHPSYFAGMAAESVIFAILLAVGVALIVKTLMTHVPLPHPNLMHSNYASIAFVQDLALSMGAGLYEELVFRVVLTLGLAFLLGLAIKHPPTAFVIAALISAVLFSSIHYLGALGDPFQINTFIFRVIFGLSLQALMAWRGFGVAAWTHALYDVLVVSGVWG